MSKRVFCIALLKGTLDHKICPAWYGCKKSDWFNISDRQFKISSNHSFSYNEVNHTEIFFAYIHGNKRSKQFFILNSNEASAFLTFVYDNCDHNLDNNHISPLNTWYNNNSNSTV